jgi:DeoR/GlpR family transcriptional regulator of sugar metabolism
LILSRISTQKRQQSILELLSQTGEVQVESLSQRFETSEVTIRKDLRLLESQQKLVRRFGGAVKILTKNNQNESNKVSIRKQAIAKAAVSLIEKGNRIVLDSGSTVQAMVPYLVNRNDLVVMTNSLKVASKLTEADTPPKVLFTGGTWDQQSESFQGNMAEQMLDAYDFDIAFIGAAGLDPNRGTTTYNELVNLSKTMAANSASVVVMAEANKLNKKIPNIELPWSSVSSLITDDSIDHDSIQLISEHGINVIQTTSEER